MNGRPVDSSGDILPVVSVSDLLSGPAAAAPALRDHLNLFPGDWWEYPESGNPIFDLIAMSRKTQQDAETLCAALTAFIQEFPGIQSVSEAAASFSGHRFSFSCVAHTESGEAVPVKFGDGSPVRTGDGP